MVRAIPRTFWTTLCVLVAAGAAHARSETIQWTQTQPGIVASFEIRWGTASGSHPNIVNVGKPTPNANGYYTATLDVPDDGAVYVVARSRDLVGYYSAFSNEKVIGGSAPPPPDDDLPFSEDFGASGTGTSVPGWFDTKAQDSLAQDDSLFGVVNLGGNLVMGTSSERLNIHSHYTAASGWSNYEVRGRMRVEDATGSVGVTAYSAFPSQDVYYKLFRIGENGEDDFWIVGHPDIACDEAHTGTSPAAGAWYLFRFEVSSSSTANRIRARVWREGTAEPSFWQATCFDERSSRPRSGSFGLWSRGPGAKYWDDLQVVAVPALEEGVGGGGGSSGDELGAPGRPMVIGP